MEVSQSIVGIALVGLLALGTAGAATVVGLPFGILDSSAGPEPCTLNGSILQTDEPLLDDDCDGLSNATEVEQGLDPQDPDTDDDGLGDYAEARLTSTDPLKPDSDGDGVLDGAEDPDGDGLTNAEEIEAGSAYDMADGDRDGLTDPQELENGTDPLRADTDSDGLMDGSELDLGTDPLVNDTDGDGILDGNETFTTSVSNDALRVSVAFTGRGDVAAGASVTRDTTPGLRNDLVDPARATELIRLDAQQPFETATVTFTYDESAVPTTETDLAVYRLNRTMQFYEPVPTDIDAANNTITGRTNQTGIFTVLSPSVLAEQFSVDPDARNHQLRSAFEEPAGCDGGCGVDEGALAAGLLRETSGSQDTALRAPRLVPMTKLAI